MSKSMTLEQRAEEYAKRCAIIAAILGGLEDSLCEALLRSTRNAYIQGAKDSARWVSVEEERPEYGQIVIVRLLDGEAHQARLQKDDMWDEWDLLNQDLDYESVTHWMPLPPMPEDK